MFKLLKRIYSYVNIHHQIAAILFISLSTGIGMLIPQIIRLIIDDVLGNRQYEKLTMVGIFLVVLTLGLAVTEYMQSFIVSKMGENVTKKIRENIHSKVVELDGHTLKKYGTANVISLFNNDVTRINSLIVSFSTQFVVQIVMLSAILITMFILNLKLTLISLTSIPLYFSIFLIFGGKLQNMSMKRQKFLVKLNTSLHEDINGIDIIQSLNAGKTRHDSFIKDQMIFHNNNILLAALNSFLNQVSSIMSGFGNILVLWIGTYMVIRDEITLGSLVAFTSYLGRIYSPIISIATVNQVFNQVAPSLTRIFNFLDIAPKMVEDTGSEELNDKISSIVLRNVYLKYEEEDKYALENVSMEFMPDRITAIIGESGAGKSTVAKLLNRLVKLSDGNIIINGKDSARYTLNSIRSAIGVLNQEIRLFNGTIRDNVKLGIECDDEEVYMALKRADALKFVERLENGIDTDIRENGVNISYGEAQRIALARMLLRDFDVFVFDEPTASVDNLTARTIIKNICMLSKNKIIIIISHRLEDIKFAHYIYLMKEGKIIGEGTYEELLQGHQYFRQLNIS